ncbi:uncharacterized protein IUM83_02895 [Phytophthora cinnamomi]|uniref:uncharacterized protein n=1 Tax=Phytophthora cinnamomi TaxID=4785 RepID=UPI0035599DA5|nr:hypothetical protein IUM83_02895 [Phytophthora cinnamomi]
MSRLLSDATARAFRSVRCSGQGAVEVLTEGSDAAAGPPASSVQTPPPLAPAAASAGRKAARTPQPRLAHHHPGPLFHRRLRC